MTTQNHPTLPRIGPVRRSVWLFLFGSLLVALALPLLTLWHAAASPLTAQVCLWPPTPQVRETARLVVTVPDATDQAAVDGPWAQVLVSWDMVTHTMGTRHLSLSGTTSQAGTFSLPLQVNMAGLWWADLTLQTPGRPDWHTRVQFTVAPPEGPLQATPTPTTGVSVTPCSLARDERKSSL